jgi:hypothetical protein
MAPRKRKGSDDLGRKVSEGLALLAVGRKFGLAEANQFNEMAAAIVGSVMRVRELEQRTKALDAELTKLKRLRSIA